MPRKKKQTVAAKIASSAAAQVESGLSADEQAEREALAAVKSVPKEQTSTNNRRRSKEQQQLKKGKHQRSKTGALTGGKMNTKARRKSVGDGERENDQNNNSNENEENEEDEDDDYDDSDFSDLEEIDPEELATMATDEEDSDGSDVGDDTGEKAAKKFKSEPLSASESGGAGGADSGSELKEASSSLSPGGTETKDSTANPNVSASEREKLRRRLPLSIKELIDYHSSNGKSIKEIVSRINDVCRQDEKVSYGYVQKYLYRKKLEATTAKKARYYRKKYGFVYRRMRRKPVLTESHRTSRIAWCGTHENDKFERDIFIGKTSLKPFLASLNQLKGQPADPNVPRQQTTLHLWGAISRRGASPLQIFDGALTTAMYLEILLENVVPFIAENFPEGHRFHQDNNPKHSAKLSQEFLESTGINWVKSPPRSHDLNPIELVWTDLIQVVAKRLPKTIGQVVIAVKEYWKTLTPEKCSEFIDKLVDVVPKVVEKKGEWVSIS